MSTSTIVTAHTTLPRVNLLPPEIEADRRFTRVKVALAATVLASAAAVAGVYTAASADADAAQEELGVAQRKNAALTREVAQYADVPRVQSELAQARDRLAVAMNQEVRWSYYLNDTSLGLPSRVWLTEMSVAEGPGAAGSTGAAGATATAGPAGASGSAGSTGGAGAGSGAPPRYTVRFAGKALGHDDVAAWLESLARQKGYANPYFTLSELKPEQETKAVTFASTVEVTDDALSRRYSNQAGE